MENKIKKYGIINPAFKDVEFDTFLHEAGANRFLRVTPRLPGVTNTIMVTLPQTAERHFQQDSSFRKLRRGISNRIRPSANRGEAFPTGFVLPQTAERHFRRDSSFRR